ncbi:exopolysaccharide biosynthesis protein [Phyllobacterium sp. 628]|uniref:exopolysaccharide biosynthesis protein n=1 Tax=Phyllobacterium sp. 628 TaxID=2718938 RepID=UPI001FCED507|nr:exopolysaccharide biosynthesis protein [Phyllobacterium sp. 628]
MQDNQPRESKGIASTRLYELAALSQSRGGLEIGDILSAMGQTGTAFIILFLALPAITPIPGPFGMVFGTALALVSLQIIVGRQTIWLPQSLRRRRISSAIISRIVQHAAPIIARVERHMRPGRLEAFTGTSVQMLLGIPVFLLAVIIALPIPFGNLMPVFALTVIAVALMERDGLITLMGLVLSVVAFGVTFGLLYAGASMLAAVQA